MTLLLVIFFGIFLFSFIGVILLLRSSKAQAEHISKIERRLDGLALFLQSQKTTPAASQAPASVAPTTIVPEVVVPKVVVPPSPAPATVAPEVHSPPVEPPAEAPSPWATGRYSPRSVPVYQTPPEPVPAAEEDEEDSKVSPWIESLEKFIRGGNLWAAGGVVLLIVAFGMLIAFLARRGFFTVEMGIIGAAVSGMVMLFLGWRFRDRRRVFCLLLQGGGIGILYLAVFAAHKLTPYFPPLLSIILMTLLMAPAIVLALLQNSQALALLGFFGGFAAPILLASDQGNHVLLFSYYLVLNAGVLVIGYFRSWKWLNLMAFICTFATTLVWVIGSYNQSLFWTTEPFCIAFILVFTALGILSLKNPSARGFDIPVIVGTPVVGAVLQWNLVSHILYGHAIVSVAFSALYIALSVGVWRGRERLSTGSARPLAEAYLALSVMLANVAIPLLLSAQATSAVWVAEGAALLLVGLRLKNVQTIIWGFIVHVAGAIAFGVGNVGAGYGSGVFQSPQFAGALIVAMSALAMTFLLNGFATRKQVRYPLDNPVIPRLLTVWACLWWFGSWLFELWRITGRRIDESFFGLNEPWGAFFLLCSISAVLFFVVARLFRYPWLNAGIFPSVVTAILLVLGILFLQIGANVSHPTRIFTYNFFYNEYLWAWLVFFAVQAVLLVLLRKKTIHAGWLFTVILVTLIVLTASGRAFIDYFGLSVSWKSLAGILPGLAALLGATFLNQTGIPGLHRKLLLVTLPVILCGFLGLWFFVTLFLPGNPDPLPIYVPFINPLDLQQGFCIAGILLWLARNRKETAYVIGDIAVFLWVTAIIARSVHFYGSIPMFRILVSPAFHLGILIFWGLFGIAHIVAGHKIKQRPVWVAGAVLTVADIAKLLLFDLAGTAPVIRIVSFFIAGLILLFIGWVAPLPPSVAKES